MNLIKRTRFFLRVAGNNILPIERKVIDFYHLTIILKGTFTYIVDGEEISLEPGDAMLLAPGTDRERLAYPDYADIIILNFHATKEFENTSNVVFKKAVTEPIKALINAYPYRFFHNVDVTNYRGREYREYDIQEKNKVNGILHNLYNCILIDLFDSLKHSAKNQHVNNTLKYISDNITKPLTLDSICKEIHLSKEYTARVFKREIGLTVTQYINQQKLDIAKNLLLIDEFDLQNIAEKVGYQNYNYFSRIFKKQFGITPIAMKMELKKANRNSSLYGT